MSLTTDITKICIELGAALANEILDAIVTKDPSKLKKVTDVFPPGHVMRARIAYLEQLAIAEQELANLKPKPTEKLPKVTRTRKPK